MAVFDETAEGTPPPRLAGWRHWLPILLALLASFSLLQYACVRLLFDPESAALGAQTQPLFGDVGGRRIHCNDLRDSATCVAAYHAAGRPPAVLWLGNSQLHGVNRYAEGQASAPMRLHEALAAKGSYLVTYSQPNANVMEHQAIFHELRRKYDVRTLILAVCFDDFREQGIRETIRAAPERKDQAGASAPPNAQTLVEGALDAELQKQVRLWHMRQGLATMADYAVYVLRNRMLGITAQTPRSVSPTVYAERMQTVKDIVREARDAGIKVVLYLPPYRSDVSGPYVPTEYAALRAELTALSKGESVKVLDLTSIVPGSEWGTLTDPLFGFVDYDFMHFTAEGHRRLAEALAPTI